MQSDRGQFVLLTFFMFGLMLLGLFIVAYKMEQITLYAGPTLFETFWAEIGQAVSAGKEVIEYLIDKGRHFR